MSQRNSIAEMAALCRNYVALRESECNAFRETIGFDPSAALTAFADERTAERRTLPEIENALLAAGLAYDECEDPRDALAAVQSLTRTVEANGLVPYIVAERVAPFVSKRAAEMLRGVSCRRLSRLRFADDAEPAVPQHNVFETLLHRPRLVFLLVRALETSLQIRIDRARLRIVLRAVWSDLSLAESVKLTSEESQPTLMILVAKYQGEVLVQLTFQPPMSISQKWNRRKHREQERLRFRMVIEGFTTAFAPLVFANTDRLTMFQRSTHQIFDWQRNSPVMRRGLNLE